MSIGDAVVAEAGHEGWIKSSYSNASGSCVEVKNSRDMVSIRDGKDRRPGQPTINFAAKEWDTFLEAIVGH